MNPESIASSISPLENSPEKQSPLDEIISIPRAETSFLEARALDKNPELSQLTQVHLRSTTGGVMLILPPEVDTPAAITFSELVEQLQQRLVAGDRFWESETPVHLVAQDRLLDGRQLQSLSKALHQGGLTLVRVITNRRQTAVVAASSGYSVEQQLPFRTLNASPEKETMLESLYLETTVRSGREINYPGTVVILGDVNAGGLIVAAGDILIWGKLKGTAHAGAKGNSKCRIMALEMQPTQLRIADAVARAPETPPQQYYPEVAYITPAGIRIARAVDFPKYNL